MNYGTTLVPHEVTKEREANTPIEENAKVFRAVFICVRDASRHDQKTRCKATLPCSWLSASLADQRMYLFSKHNSNPVADRQFPKHFRHCTRRLRSESISRHCRAEDNSPRGQKHFRLPVDRLATREFRAAMRATHVIPHPGAHDQRNTHLSERVPAIHTGYSEGSPRAFAYCVGST